MFRFASTFRALGVCSVSSEQQALSQSRPRAPGDDARMKRAGPMHGHIRSVDEERGLGLHPKVAALAWPRCSEPRLRHGGVCHRHGYLVGLSQPTKQGIGERQACTRSGPSGVKRTCNAHKQT
jgi:hypothetical protein